MDACGRHCGWCGRCTHERRDEIERHCSRCGEALFVSRSEDYRVQVLCDGCWQGAVRAQELKMQRGAA